jgi:hypothetical protein
MKWPKIATNACDAVKLWVETCCVAIAFTTRGQVKAHKEGWLVEEHVNHKIVLPKFIPTIEG